MLVLNPLKGTYTLVLFYQDGLSQSTGKNNGFSVKLGESTE